MSRDDYHEHVSPAMEAAHRLAMSRAGIERHLVAARLMISACRGGDEDRRSCLLSVANGLTICRRLLDRSEKCAKPPISYERAAR
jgi:hypothetical protein